ncbi:FAD-dependent oxidoreductase [Pararhodobacter oceanensis]|uniref:FAD-dependent oxidoreductase n=1 Tax=Pararhodobacter oceanensis TaxID=2172121 RepID=UPI003A931699
MTSIAIVGAGPSGCYTAQALAKALPEARIDLIDRLPVPYGLIRYGVAPDHQGTKAVIRQFERLFTRNDVAFFGNVTLGADLTLEDLRASHEAVVLATGLHADRRLGIAGEDLAGVIGSGVVTRGWNDYPDAERPQIGPRVVIVGNGNVAVDLLRILAKAPAEFDGSDLAPESGAALQAAGVTRIDVVGRSGAELAKFDPVMLRELGRLAQASLHVHGVTGEGKVIEALQAIDGHRPERATRVVHFHFGWTPEGIEGGACVEAVKFRASNGEGTLHLPCDTVLTAIGFDGETAQADGDGRIAEGLYATGWYRRGPRGTIPENRADAQAVAARIAADLAQATSDKPGRAALTAGLPEAVGYDGWRRIDAAECAACPPDRTRRKIATRAEMLTLARQSEDR